MGIRVRPIGEIKSQPDPAERVKCWKCATWFMMPRTATRSSCPNCGSQVALHRLKMPMMPSGKGRQPETRSTDSSRDIESGTPGEGDAARKPGPELGGEEVRRMFVEADPRREGGVSGREILRGISLRTLIALVGVATLILLILSLVTTS
jgi:predicted RNA-binding Zn-ribbon protein involved in translation (DUF1610 family)